MRPTAYGIAWVLTGFVSAAIAVAALGQGKPLLWLPAAAAFALSVLALLRS